MPKKKNFLGGMQNYNPNNGEYEPALKGPNGESPSQFSSFKKEKDESFDAINEKRMGGEKTHKESDKNAEIFNDYKEEYTQAYKEGGEKGLKDAVLKSGYTTDQYNYALEQLKGGSSEKLSGNDLVDEFQDRLQSLSNDYNIGLQDDESTIGELKKIKADLESKKNLLDEEQYKSLSEEIDRQIGAGSSETNSFEEINAKRMGKEQPKSEETTKSHKSADRKDKYGNPLVSDDAFKVGQKAAKEYLEESLKYNSLDSLKKSNVFLGYMQDKISRAIEDAELNPDYDMTYDDFNEIIGSVIGEEIDLEEYEGNATKGWTGKKYSGYDPSKTEEPKKVQYFKHPEVDGVWHDTGKTVERNGNTYKIFENEEGGTWGVSERFAKQFQETDEPKHPFKLDKDKYPDVEETPYGFIYNVNGKSITDLDAQKKKMGYSLSTKDSGFTVAVGGEEVYFQDFESAYNYAKSKK